VKRSGYGWCVALAVADMSGGSVSLNDCPGKHEGAGIRPSDDDAGLVCGGAWVVVVSLGSCLADDPYVKNSIHLS